MNQPLRLLLDPPQDGATNMAADDALMQSVAARDAPPTLRLYRWAPPCISLGYFQPSAAVEQQNLPHSVRREVVRRVTGGGAILHDQELTYSLTLPAGHPLAGTSPEPLYRIVHEAVILGCRLNDMLIRFREEEPADDLPPEQARRRDSEFFCFHRLHRLDLVCQGLKVLGSAQRRTRQTVLQHGSLILVRRYHQQRCLALSMLAGKIITWEAASDIFLQGWNARLPDWPLQPGEWTDSELACIWPLVAKHRGAEWRDAR